MTSMVGESRPYAAPSNVVSVLVRARSRNLPETISNEFLRLADVPETVFGRVMTALRFLDLVTEDGRPTETLLAISGAPEAQYRELLAASIRTAYADDFQRIDPARDPQGKIQDAFTPYQPRSQTQRMVILLLGLCREAEIPVLDVPRDRKMQVTLGKQGRIPRSREVQRPKASQKRAEAASTQNQYPVAQLSPSGLAFGVTDDDLASLGQEEFEEVWNALGKVMRARAKVRSMPHGATDLLDNHEQSVESEEWNEK